MSCLETTQQTFSVARMFTSLSITNEYDSPILALSDTLILIPSKQVLKSVSIFHLCNSDCKFVNKSSTLSIEREILTVSTLFLQHNYTNDFYFLNIYCM